MVEGHGGEGEDQSGKVNAGDPVLFTVSVGGKSATACGGRAAAPSQAQSNPSSYDRPPPPPPAETRPSPGLGGLKGKLFGKAKGFLKH